MSLDPAILFVSATTHKSVRYFILPSHCNAQHIWALLSLISVCCCWHRSNTTGALIDQTAVKQSAKASVSDPHSMYHSKALQAELRSLDAQEAQNEVNRL